MSGLAGPTVVVKQLRRAFGAAARIDLRSLALFRLALSSVLIQDWIDDWTVIALSDGAGASRLSRVGARIACDEGVKALAGAPFLETLEVLDLGNNYLSAAGGGWGRAARGGAEGGSFSLSSRWLHSLESMLVNATRMSRLSCEAIACASRKSSSHRPV